ncbi:MAG TPA: IS5 family transposase [Acidobacteriaceae bacterium]
MRGDDLEQLGVFSYVSAEQRIAKDHPLRGIRRMVDEALKALSSHFDALYARGGRPSIAPEKLMRALLLQVLYSVKSERQLMEQIDYNLLFRWFVGLNMDDAIWDATVFTKNRERLMRGEVSERLLMAVVEQARAAQLLSEEHFTVDGTLIQAWANRRSFHPKPDPPDKGTGARGRKLLRDTHASTTDPEARLFKKSGAAMAVPSYIGHVLTENRNGLVVAALATQSSSTAEREAAVTLIDRMRLAAPITLGADKSYQEERFIEQLRARRVKPHVAEYAPNPQWPSFLTQAERSDPGFAVSQRKRKLVEKVFGWAKLDRAVRQVKLRGLNKVDWLFRLVAAAHNLRRMQTLLHPA